MNAQGSFSYLTDVRCNSVQTLGEEEAVENDPQTCL